LPDLGLLLVALLLTGAGITFAQTGFLWSSHNISPDLNRLNPIPGLKRIFSPNGLMELGKMLLKLLVIGWVVYSFLRSHLQELLLMAGSDLSHSMAVWVGLASGLALQVSGVYLVLALADFVYQRWFFRRSLRMTRDEVKEEMKRTEGDPVLKGRIRQQQRRLARQRMMANVRKADVVITNPTHLAVAVQYEANRMHAPRVLAKGAYRVAARIVELARIHRVPVVQNPPLARAIYRSVDVEQEIPPDLYLVMAEVLAYVYRLRAPGRSGANPGLRALPHAAGLAAAPDTTG
jgi:flagellar biosynthetic protein FlhB